MVIALWQCGVGAGGIFLKVNFDRLLVVGVCVKVNLLKSALSSSVPPPQALPSLTGGVGGGSLFDGAKIQSIFDTTKYFCTFFHFHAKIWCFFIF